MRTTGNKARGRSRLALTTTLVLAVLAALLLAGPALAAGHEGLSKSARPGKPTALTPSGSVSTATPTFTWSRAEGATSYEVRVHEGSELLLMRAGIRARSWTSRLALPVNVDLAWKVRGSKAGRAGAWSRSRAFRVTSLSSAKALTAFSFQGLAPPVVGVISETLHTVALTMPAGTNLTALVASFTTTGASVAVAGAPQTSGVTANNFTNPLTYTVTAVNASTQAYVVTVTVAAAGLAIGDPYQGGVVAYILQSGDPGYVAGETRGLIAAVADQSTGIPWYNGSFTVTGATATALGAGFANTNAIIAAQGPTATSYAAGLARAYSGGGYSDWYLPGADELAKLYVNRGAIGGFGSAHYWSSSEKNASGAYDLWFADGNQYTDRKDNMRNVRAVRAFPAVSSAKAITTFSFRGLTPPAIGAINQTAHTIAVTVPAGTNVTALVPTIITTGASVSPASGVANNFTNPVIYTATAGDGTTQDYVVTVTVAAPMLAIGDACGGGTVAYILQSGDPGYDANVQHGLIAATADQTPSGSGIRWALPGYWPTSVPGGTGTAIGTGAANTNAIIAQNGAGSTYAAGLARAYAGGGYSDWFLPSKDELNKLHLNRAAIGGFANAFYWSSSEYNAGQAWPQIIGNGLQYFTPKGWAYRVRAVRAF